METPESNADINNSGQSTNQQPLNVVELVELFKEVLKEVNINEAISSFNSVKIEKIKSEEKKSLETLKSEDLTRGLNIRFWTRKFIKEFLVLLIILIAICLLAYTGKIDINSVGTLLGSIIGYAIGNFNSSNKER